MVATPQEITAGRQVEGNDMTAMRQLCGSTAIGNRTYANAGGGQVSVVIASEGGDPGNDLKLDSIDKAIRAVIEAGFRLPDMTFYCSNTQGVQCRAFMGDAGGQRAYTVFMGPKTGEHNPQTGSMPGLKGGTGANGERGVADQMYDGTHRWFGNPKQHAHATCVVIHEIGHILHDFTNEGLFWDFKRGVAPQAGNGWLNAAMTVSHYATKNPLEMVAETFAGAVSGKAYQQPVQAAYQGLGGAAPQGGAAFP